MTIASTQTHKTNCQLNPYPPVRGFYNVPSHCHMYKFIHSLSNFHMYYDADVISYFHELQGVFSVGPKIFVFATERVKADFFSIQSGLLLKSHLVLILSVFQG